MDVQVRQEFFASEGASFSDRQAAAAGPELLRLKEKHGEGLRPSDIVHAATDLKSPLHPFFTWDNSEAAGNWRRNEASYLIRHIRVRIVRADTGKVLREEPILLTVRPKPEETVFKDNGNFGPQPERRLVTVHEARQDPDVKTRIIRETWRDLLAFARRYDERRVLLGENAEEFDSVFAVARAAVEAVRQKVQPESAPEVASAA